MSKSIPTAMNAVAKDLSQNPLAKPLAKSKSRLSRIALSCALVSVLGLTGCAAMDDSVKPEQVLANQQNHQAQSMSQLIWSPLPVPAELSFDINQHSQTLIMQGQAIHVAAFELPTNQGLLNFHLRSYADKILYPASIKIVNQDNKVLLEKTFADAEYKTPQLTEQDRFELDFSIMPSYQDERLKLLIYTRAEDKSGQSSITHPAKVFAINKGTVPPNISDPIVSHSDYGSLYLTVKSSLTTQQVTPAMTVNDHTPPLEETQSYYLNQIDSAVEAGDLEKAFKLADEAQRLGITDARARLIKALKSK
ncbi:MAG: MalM family protein [Vibrio sp.]